MNNEPVAWMHTTICSWVSTFIHPETEPEEWIPLYTHPAKELDEQFKKGFEAGKEEGWKAHKFHHPADLTDEEIIEIWSGMETDTGEQNIAFARAILRKAQEK